MGKAFDPVRDIRNADLILDTEGQWPNFHDAEVLNVNLWRGDLRPDEKVYTFPVIDLAFWLSALERPFRADLRFHGCDQIRIDDFNYNNTILELEFTAQCRGFRSDGKTALPNKIVVKIISGFGLGMEFSCSQIEAIARSEEATRTEKGGHAIPLELIGSPRGP